MRRYSSTGVNASGFLLVAFILFCSCSVSKIGYNPEEKIPPAKLQADYQIFRSILEESHPSLYWFQSKDSMDFYFDQVAALLNDSMTERSFRSHMTYLAARIRCGHTSVQYSDRYAAYLDTARLKTFPLRLKFSGEQAIVTGTLLLKDSMFPRGTVITSVNGHDINQLRDTFFYYLTGDGNSVAGKYQSLSNAGNFGILYKNLYGLTDTFSIGLIDRNGLNQLVNVPVFDPSRDSLFRVRDERDRRLTGRERRRRERFAARNIQIDTTLSSAYMTVNTFSRGNGLRGFFRKSFKAIRKEGIKHVAIDVRGNGGGDAGNSTLLTQYIIDRKFRIADSLYAIKRTSRYRRYIRWQPVYWFMTTLVTNRRDDKFHFGYFERHMFKPRKRNHFKGDIYILIGGNSFSATTIFAQQVKGQKNVTLVGEETGGGSYGNTAWMIPEVRLPNTGIRFRLPKFRLVMNADMVKEGRGVMPDITVWPDATDIKNGVDVKVEEVRRLIMQKNFEF